VTRGINGAPLRLPGWLPNTANCRQGPRAVLGEVAGQPVIMVSGTSVKVVAVSRP